MRSLLLILALALSGCTTPGSTSAIKTPGYSWQAGKFAIVFQAGTQTSGVEPKRSYSYYKVQRDIPPYSVPTFLAIESAHSVEHFEWNPKQQPSDFIKSYLSDSGDTMLITEEIPNDCSPCTNYILVRVLGSEMNYEYLSIPMNEKSAEPEGETGQVVKISDSEVTYKYSVGPAITKSFNRLRKPDRRPTFPG